MVDDRKVPEGYKVTEVGVIPENWDTNLLGDIIVVYRGGSPRPIQDYLTTSNSGINWIKIGDVGIGAKYIEKTEEKIIPEGITRSRYVKPGDLLLSNSMSFGRPYILRTDGCIHDGWLVLKNYEETLESNFLYYLLSSDVVLQQYKSKAAGSGVLNLNKDLVNSVNLVVPPLTEQKSIAEALSDTDNLIQSLEKLIDKKKKIKQGAMQQLLTGKKRLPGFIEQWEIKKLGDIVSINKGQLITEKDAQDGTIPVIAGGKKPSYYHSFPNRQGKTITISASGANAGYVGFYTEPIFASDCSTIGENDKYSIEFIYYQLLMLQETIYYAQTGGAQPHIHPKDLKPLLINYTNLKEQNAIAQVLSDMDAEIEALEEKLKKYKTIKQGMMQELLTGRIRLI